MLLDFYESLIKASRIISEEMFGVMIAPPKPSIEDKVYDIISLVFYTIIWWVLLIPCAIIRGIYQAVRDHIIMILRGS